MRGITRVSGKETQAGVISQSAVIFFMIFVLTYVLSDDDFRQNAKIMIVVFTVSRLILKFAIFIPYKEMIASRQST